jgi:diguanylate cyclase (GGDEF)-like protein
MPGIRREKMPKPSPVVSVGISMLPKHHSAETSGTAAGTAQQGRPMFSLLRYFSIASLVSMVLAAIFLAIFHQQFEKQQLLRFGESRNIMLAQVFSNSIWPQYQGFAKAGKTLDTDALRNRPEIARLNRSVREAMRGSPTVGVKIYLLNGRTLFSNDAAQIGAGNSSDPGFLSARLGVPASQIVADDRSGAFGGKLAGRDVLSSYVPVRGGEDEPIEAVIKIYTDVTELQESEAREDRLLILSVAGVLAGLYGILFFIARHADRVIRNQYEQQRRVEQSLRHVTTHDALTNLPNRLLLLDRIKQSLPSAERHNNLLAVATIDLDNFQSINSSLGHQVGDNILKIVAQRLSQCLREGDTIARVGGDEFVASLPDIHSNVNLFQIAKKMLSIISVPIESEGRELHLTASIGIALYPEHGSDAETLMRKADMAMHSAKRLGRNRHQMFVEHMDEQVQQQVQLEDELWRAMKNNEFVLYYQPVVDLSSGAIIGAEALLRWPNRHGDWISPSEFIPLTEQCGLIVPLSEWVFSEACTQLQMWRHFETAGLATMIAGVVERAEIDPKRLYIEITESMLIGNNESALANFAGLKHIGTRFSLDDFGTGYSSLGYLRNYPIDLLKIDRTFVEGLPENADNAAIVTTIIALANSVNLSVVAKGVETAAQAAFLQQQGCHYGQGFLFSGPLPPDEFLSLVLERRGKDPAESPSQLTPSQ